MNTANAVKDPVGQATAATAPERLLDGLPLVHGPGEYVLRITTTFDRGVPAFPRDAPPPHVADIPVRVR